MNTKTSFVKALIALLVYCAFGMNAKAQIDFASRFSYITVRFTVPGTPEMDYTQVEFDSYVNSKGKVREFTAKTMQTIFNELGQQGYELLQIEKFPNAASRQNVYYRKFGGSDRSFVIAALFKKSDSPREEHLEYLANKTDSIADGYVKKAIYQARLDLLSVINDHTKNTLSKDFIKEVTGIFETMLKQHIEAVKQEIIKELKNPQQ
jgi:hypothetical protein